MFKYCLESSLYYRQFSHNLRVSPENPFFSKINFWKLTQLTSGARHNKKRPQLISRLAWAVNIKVIYLESYSWYGYTFFTRLYMSHIPCLVRPKLISLTWVTNLFLEVVVLCDLVFPSFTFELFVVSIAAMQIFGQSR